MLLMMVQVNRRTITFMTNFDQANFNFLPVFKKSEEKA